MSLTLYFSLSLSLSLSPNAQRHHRRIAVASLLADGRAVPGVELTVALFTAGAAESTPEFTPLAGASVAIDGRGRMRWRCGTVAPAGAVLTLALGAGDTADAVGAVGAHFMLPAAGLAGLRVAGVEVRDSSALASALPRFVRAHCVAKNVTFAVKRRGVL